MEFASGILDQVIVFFQDKTELALFISGGIIEVIIRFLPTKNPYSLLERVAIGLEFIARATAAGGKFIRVIMDKIKVPNLKKAGDDK